MQKVVGRKQRAASGVLLLALALGGCGLGRSTPQDVARDFVTAAQTGDQERAGRTLTAKARENVATSVHWLESTPNTTNGFTVGDAQISGDAARVPITLTDNDGSRDADLHLRQEDSKWRVSGIEWKSGIGPALDVDFEHPENVIGSAFRTAGQAMGVFTRGMEQGAKQFDRGFDEGYKSSTLTQHEEEKKDSTAGKTTIEEVTPPPSRETKEK